MTHKRAALPDEYYVQNKHAQYLGNSPTWWAKDGKGYTAYILGAHRFSKEEAEKLVSEDTTKWRMFKCADVDARLHLVFDAQDIPRLGTDEGCGWPSGYASRPQPAEEIVGLREAIIEAELSIFHDESERRAHAIVLQAAKAQLGMK